MYTAKVGYCFSSHSIDFAEIVAIEDGGFSQRNKFNRHTCTLPRVEYVINTISTSCRMSRPALVQEEFGYNKHYMLLAQEQDKAVSRE